MISICLIFLRNRFLSINNLPMRQSLNLNSAQNFLGFFKRLKYGEVDVVAFHLHIVKIYSGSFLPRYS